MFSYDSTLMRVLGKVTDLVILNLLTLFFCIPIVTIGASVTAAHYTALKLRRGEGYVFSNFWKSFKVNFVQSTIISFIFTVFVGITLFAIMINSQASGTMAAVSQGMLLVSLIFAVFIGLWTFPLQSKFINRVPSTLRNAFMMAFKHIFRTIGMLLISAVPVVLILVLPFQWWSLLLLFGISVPIYVCACLYDKVFEKIEEMIMERERGEDEEEGAESLIEEVVEDNNLIEETPSV